MEFLAAVAGVVWESIVLTDARTEGRRASWIYDAEGKEIPEVALNEMLLVESFLLLVASGLGVLALGWATVVLLGGFSSMLERIDFWFTTAIVFIETARILGYNSGPEARFLVDVVSDFSRKDIMRVRNIPEFVHIIRKGPAVITLFFQGITLAPIFAAAGCITLSIMRILPIARNWKYGDSSNGNIKPALILFYVLVLTQGSLFILWFLFAVKRWSLTEELRKYFGNMEGGVRGGVSCTHSKEEGTKLINRYVASTVDKCMEKGVASTMNRTLVSFAAELLQSEVSADHFRAVSVLHAVITRKERTAGAVQQLYASKESVGRLFEILSSEGILFNQEIKACSAADTNIFFWFDHYYIKKLTQSLGVNNDQQSIDNTNDGQSNSSDGADRKPHIKSPVHHTSFLIKMFHNIKKKYMRALGHPNTSDGADRKPLIVHGLFILAKLAKNPKNAKEIYDNKDLLSRITAPISNELYKVLKDDETAMEITAKSLLVLSKIVSGTDVPQEICDTRFGPNTIHQILLTDDCKYNKLKVPAIKMLTKLILTASSRYDYTIADFINVLMKLFFTDANDSILRKTAGKALALLSMDRNIFCEMVVKGNMGTDSFVQKLTNMLSDSRNKLCRTSVAKLLMQFCATLRSEEGRQHLEAVTTTIQHLEAVKTTILQEVLKTICNVEQEMDLPQAAPFKKKLHAVSVLLKGEDRPVLIELGRRKTLVALLGLAVQMCEFDELLNASDLDVAVEQIFSSKAELVVDKLKEVVEMCNKESVALLMGKGPSADYLEIIRSVTKLCKWVMLTKPDYRIYFQKKNIAQKLEDALEAMRGLEMTLLLSCSAKEIANYEPLASIVKDAQSHIPPQPDNEDRDCCSCLWVGV